MFSVLGRSLIKIVHVLVPLLAVDHIYPVLNFDIPILIYISTIFLDPRDEATLVFAGPATIGQCCSEGSG